MKRLIFTTILISFICFAAFGQASKNVCPEITVSIRNEMAGANEIVFVFAEIGAEVYQYDVTYQWTTANSKILAGQGTKAISVLRNSGDTETVTLEVIGLPKECINSNSESIPAIDPPEAVLIDEFEEIKQGDKKARLDVFLNELQNNPQDKGLIVVSQNKGTMSQLKFYDYYLTAKNLIRL